MNDPTRKPPDANTAPPEIPDVDLLRVIGEGGFGQVWLAVNRTTGQLRAVKVIPLAQSGRLDLAGREITSISRLGANAQLQHPNLLTIHHAGRTEEHFFYIMEPADDLAGDPAVDRDDYRPASLQARLASGPLSPEECLRDARSLLAALACLHQAGMVHRDVKPANCLFVQGELKLGDFGLLSSTDRQISRVGTQAYMPPDGRMDARADVYAAGLVIYEMLSGLPSGSFPRLGRRTREVAADATLSGLNRLVLRACEHDPRERFADAREMLAALAARRPEAARARRRILAGIATALALLIALVVGLRPGPAEPASVNLITYPFEATVCLDGVLQSQADGTPYRTPCTIAALPAGPHRVVFRHEGLPDLDLGTVDFTATRQAVGRWNDR